MHNKDEPAMPFNLTAEDAVREQFSGLSKREYLAGLAMQGQLSSQWYQDFRKGVGESQNIMDEVSEQAVAHADTLLEKLDETDQESGPLTI